ncbi:hypothetical protein [Haloechinothrix aidingensis]|nr:hypothetical protein [Haloechinothrix aidingensis]
MGKLKRDVASLGAASVLLAGVSAIAVPGTAVGSSPLIAGSCGATLEGEPGQPISLDLESALGISGAPTISLGTAQEGTSTFAVPESELLGYLGDLSLLGISLPSVCEVTVTAVNTVSEPVQEATEPVTEAVEDTTEQLGDTVDDVVGGGGGGNDPAPAPGTGGGSDGSGTGGKSGGSGDAKNDPEPKPSMRSPNSAAYDSRTVPGWSNVPTSMAGGMLPMDSFASVPYANSSMVTSPGVRYGSDVPGYSPEFGLLGQGESGAEQRELTNAGSADALPSQGSGTVGAPMLIAVLALSMASAGLVRSWVLRKALASA